jgi:hypothetical protein
MIQKLLKVGKCPKIWKSSRTILLLKVGDRKDPGNWRPISLTNDVYRTITAKIMKCLFKVHERVPFVSLNQKGFIPGISGCSEHAAKANSIILNASRDNRSLYIVALDLKDAFCSISHQIIKQNMNDIGIPQQLIGIIGDIYYKSSTKIMAGKSKSREI